MGNKEFLCTLRPLGEYFLGGERTFRFDDMKKEEKDGKIDYYIVSEDMPSQTTLLGALRFLVLEKAGQLSDTFRDTSKAEAQRKLVGAHGFLLDSRKEKANYGAIEEIGPLFLLTEKGRRLIPAPLNTRKGATSYAPFSSMYPCRTEMGADTLLPGTEDYEAKAGLPKSFLDLEDGTLTKRSEIFSEKEHTRIKKMSDKQGFFKKVCKSLAPGCSFAFHCRASEDALPEKAVVYVGQDKSAFAFSARAVKDGESKEALLEKIGKLTKGEVDAAVFYAASDALADMDAETQKQFLFYVLQKRPFRNMVAGNTKGCYRDSVEKSNLYQMIRAGSVFYVRRDCREAFLKQVTAPGAYQIGLNVMVEIGGK